MDLKEKCNFSTAKGYSGFGSGFYSISFNNKYIITTGGYNEAGPKADLYDCERDTLKPLSDLIEGRFRHTMCKFNE